MIIATIFEIIFWVAVILLYYLPSTFLLPLKGMSGNVHLIQLFSGKKIINSFALFANVFPFFLPYFPLGIGMPRYNSGWLTPSSSENVSPMKLPHGKRPLSASSQIHMCRSPCTYMCRIWQDTSVNLFLCFHLPHMSPMCLSIQTAFSY